MKTLADKIKEGTIKEYIFRSKGDIERGLEEAPVFKDADTIQKLLSNIVVNEKFPSLPCMADGKKFELFEKEFAFERLVGKCIIDFGEVPSGASSFIFIQIKSKFIVYFLQK